MVAVHTAWALLVLAGTIAVVLDHAYAPIQAVILVITLAVNVPFKNNCPLTLIEEKLRRVHDPGYRNNGSFLATYINKIFKSNISPREANGFLAGFYTCSALLTIYGLWAAGLL